MPLGLVGAELLGAGIKGLFDVGGILMQNRYNSPVQQLRRLRRAGLPMSYMYRGQVNQQSESPNLELDLPSAVAKTQSLDNETKLVDAQTEKLDIENAINAAIRDFKLMAGDQDGTNLEKELRTEQKMKQAQAFIASNEGEIRKIQREVSQILFDEGITVQEKRQELERIKAQIVNMGKQAGLMDQLGDIRDFEAFLNKTVTDNIKSMPGWAQVLTAAILKLNSYK